MDSIKFKISLKTALILPFIILTIAVAGFVGYLLNLNAQKAVNEVAVKLRNEISANIQNQVNFFLKTAHNINQLNYSDFRDGKLDYKNVHELHGNFLKQVKTFKNVTSVYFGNIDGGLINSGREIKDNSLYIIETDNNRAGSFRKYEIDNNGNRGRLILKVPDFDSRKRMWYKKAVKKGTNTWSPVYTLFTKDGLAIAASKPVYNNRNELIGVTSVDLFLSHISSFMNIFPKEKKGSAFLMEKSGMMIASNDGNISSILNHNKRVNARNSNNSLIKSAAEILFKKFGDFQNISGKKELSFKADGEIYYLNVFPVKDKYGLDWLMVLSVPESMFTGPIEKNRLYTFLSIFVTVLFVICIGFFMAKKINKSLYGLNEAAQNMKTGLWNENTERSIFTEVNHLTDSFNQMAAKLREMLNNLNIEISERKKVEKELKKNSEFTNKIIESSALSMWISDAKGTAIKANKACLELFGASEEEVINKYNLFQDSVVQEKGFIHTIEEVFEKGVSADFIIDYNFADVDHVVVENATHKIINTILTPITDKQGNVTNVIVQATDLTKIKNTEKQLMKIDTIFKALLKHSPVYIFFKDKDIRSIYLSNNYEDLLGKPIDKVLGRTMDEIFPKELSEKMIEDDKKVIENGKLITIDEELNGRYYKTIKFPINISEGPLLAGFTLDVTEEKKAMEQKEKLNEKILQSQKIESIGIFAGGIAHDFNNILSIITGNVSYAQSQLPKDSEIYGILKDIQEGADKSAQLIKQLLTFAKGGAPIKRTLPLNPIIKKAAKFVTSGSGSKCDFILSEDLWNADVDDGQLSQVINNLVINADQAMKKEGFITIKTENCELGSFENSIPLSSGKYIKITVEDKGDGIDKSDLDKIFDPFFSTKEKGSGLGLSTSYSIIKRHGGHIEFDSKKGIGTVFHIYLPASFKKADAKKQKISGLHTGSGKILIMDDMKQILEIAVEMFKAMGYQAQTALDGQTAIDKYKEAFDLEEKYDLVILDLTVPGGMGGADVIGKILEIDPDAKVLVSSGYSNAPIMANYKDYGFCGVVSKPYTMNHLSEVISSILNS